jgi:hypothetical protein
MHFDLGEMGGDASNTTIMIIPTLSPNDCDNEATEERFCSCARSGIPASGSSRHMT